MYSWLDSKYEVAIHCMHTSQKECEVWSQHLNWLHVPCHILQPFPMHHSPIVNNCRVWFTIMTPEQRFQYVCVTVLGLLLFCCYSVSSMHHVVFLDSRTNRIVDSRQHWHHQRWPSFPLLNLQIIYSSSFHLSNWASDSIALVRFLVSLSMNLAELKIHSQFTNFPGRTFKSTSDLVF